jgi:hypothetical protein
VRERGGVAHDEHLGMPGTGQVSWARRAPGQPDRAARRAKLTSGDAATPAAHSTVAAEVLITSARLHVDAVRVDADHAKVR